MCVVTCNPQHVRGSPRGVVLSMRFLAAGVSPPPGSPPPGVYWLTKRLPSPCVLGIHGVQPRSTDLDVPGHSSIARPCVILCWLCVFWSFRSFESWSYSTHEAQELAATGQACAPERRRLHPYAGQRYAQLLGNVEINESLFFFFLFNQKPQ